MNMFRYFVLFSVLLVSGSMIIAMEYPNETHRGEGKEKTGAKPFDEQYYILLDKYDLAMSYFYSNFNAMSFAERKSLYDHFNTTQQELIALLNVYKKQPYPKEKNIAKKIKSIKVAIRVIEGVMNEIKQKIH